MHLLTKVEKQLLTRSCHFHIEELSKPRKICWFKTSNKKAYSTNRSQTNFKSTFKYWNIVFCHISPNHTHYPFEMAEMAASSSSFSAASLLLGYVIKCDAQPWELIINWRRRAATTYSNSEIIMVASSQVVINYPVGMVVVRPCPRLGTGFENMLPFSLLMISCRRRYVIN